MKTFGYGMGTVIEEIEVGEQYYFGQLVNGDEELEELLNSKCVAIYDEETEEEKIVDFKIIEENKDILQTVVEVIDIF